MWDSLKEAQFSLVVVVSELDWSHTAAPVSSTTGCEDATDPDEGSEEPSVQLGSRGEQIFLKEDVRSW